ncbi:ABC transporter ATP-binding protein [Thermoanaerobacterium thermosaccharolyticum]|uniref:ABC transporter ATP-binding protein n=1 Tax=Thermoanaerobacterium thermosaccharolyticum TaxID=1517 RepID=UPI0027AAB876|nr:ABC transporter ATP-binding protein [Thermoanaerobacterium thermosaccharolyticum]
MIFLAAVSSYITTIIPKFYQVIIDKGILNRDRTILIIYLSGILCLSLLNSMIKLFNNININKMGVIVTRDIKENVIRKILNSPMNFFDNVSKGELMERVKEIDALSSIFTPQILLVVITIITAIIATVRMIMIDWRFILVYVIALPLLTLVSFKLSSSYKNKTKELIFLNTQASKLMYEGFSGISELKSFNMLLKRQEEINSINSQIYEKAKKQNAIFSLSTELIAVINICVSVTITLLFDNFFTKGTYSIGQYVQITNYSSLILAPAQMSVTVLTMIQPVRLIIKRLKYFDFFEEQDCKKGKKVDCIKSIRFNHVDFAYGNKTVLDKLSFKIENYGITIISGKNGVGKTTVIKLLLRLYDSYNGDIFINESNIREYSVESIRNEVAVVFQDVFLFDSSIYKNIECGDSRITKQKVKKLLSDLKITSIFGNITEDEILDIPVTEGGKNLSGGQRRIISILRALVRDPSVIILDEPTANLDVNTTTTVIDTISNIKEKIVIVISHDQDLTKLATKTICL